METLRARHVPIFDALTFFGLWVRRPRSMGAIVPSSGRLARAIARQIDIGRPGVIVELGGGTGSITRAIVDHAAEGDEIVVVERESALADRLAARFPGIRVICGDAERLQELLAGVGVGPVKAIVSGLPMLSIPRRSRERILQQSFGALAPGGVFLQFTYGLMSPVRRSTAMRNRVAGCRAGWVLRNLPPASLWRYQRAIFRLQRGAPASGSRLASWPLPRRAGGKAVELFLNGAQLVAQRADLVGKIVRRRVVPLRLGRIGR